MPSRAGNDRDERSSRRAVRGSFREPIGRPQRRPRNSRSRSPTDKDKRSNSKRRSRTPPPQDPSSSDGSSSDSDNEDTSSSDDDAEDTSSLDDETEDSSSSDDENDRAPVPKTYKGHPLPPRTIQELGLPAAPTYKICVAKGQPEPSAKWLASLRDNAMQRIEQGRLPRSPEIKFSPFFHKFTARFEDLEKELNRLRSYGTCSRQVKLVRAADCYDNDAMRQLAGSVGENRQRRAVSGPTYFAFHQLPKNEYARILEGIHGNSATRKRWEDDIAVWSQNWQGHIFKIVKIGMEGLVALYTFEVFSKLNDDQVKSLLQELYQKSPIAHSLALWAHMDDTVDIIGIFRPSEDKAEEAYRAIWRASLEYRFVEAAFLVWKFMININPKLAKTYKDHAFDTWRGLIDGEEYRAIMKDIELLGDTPVRSHGLGRPLDRTRSFRR